MDKTRSKIISFSIISVLALLVLSTPSDVYGADWYSSDWDYTKLITIDSTQVDSTLSDFPLLVNITSTDLGSNAQSDCDDIFFTDSTNATKYSHEIENCDLTTDDWITAWVRIPTVSSSIDTELFMYYGNSTVSTQEDITGTWTSNYLGVYHLNDDFLDSTSNNNDGTNSGSTDVSGEFIADSQSFDGTDDNVSFGDYADSLGSISVQAWTHTDTLTLDANIGGKWGATDFNFLLWYDWIACTGLNKIAFIVATPSGTSRVCSTVDYVAGTNYHVTGTWSTGNTVKLYENSVEYIAGTLGNTMPSNTANVKIGEDDNATRDLTGGVDEFRVLDTVLTSDWISAEYDNQKSGSTFLTIGDQGTEPDETVWYNSDWTYAKLITINATQINATQTNFPLLVNFTDTDVSTNAQADCGDILFVDYTNVTKYSHEVENCDLTTDDWLTAWVKVTTISSSVDTNLFMYYGNATITNQEDKYDVFPSEYEIVYHFNDDLLDSSPNKNNATNTGSTDTATHLADGQYLDGTDDRIDSDGTISFGDGAVTMSMWINLNDTQTNLDTIISNRPNFPAGGGWVAVDTRIPDALPFIFASVGGATKTIQTTYDFLDNTWHYFVVEVQGGTSGFIKSYVDSMTTEKDSTSGSWGTFTETPEILTIGELDGFLRYGAFYADEIRLHDGLRSTETRELEYTNQKPDSTLITFGTQGVDPTVDEPEPEPDPDPEPTDTSESTGISFVDTSAITSLLQLNYLSDGHRAILGQLLTDSVKVQWESNANLEIQSIIVEDSPFIVNFQLTPFVLEGDPLGESVGEINYSIQIPNKLCTESGQIDCVEIRVYDIPIAITAMHSGNQVTNNGMITIDLESSLPQLNSFLIIIVLLLVTVFIAFLVNKVKNRTRKRAGHKTKGTEQDSSIKKRPISKSQSITPKDNVHKPRKNGSAKKQFNK
jgi:hypothetical protein